MHSCSQNMSIWSIGLQLSRIPLIPILRSSKYLILLLKLHNSKISFFLLPWHRKKKLNTVQPVTILFLKVWNDAAASRNYAFSGALRRPMWGVLLVCRGECMPALSAWAIYWTRKVRLFLLSRILPRCMDMLELSSKLRNMPRPTSNKLFSLQDGVLFPR